MSEPTCATCRHWTPPSERAGYGDVIRIRSDERSTFDQAWAAQQDADRLFGECGVICLTELSLGDPIPLAVAMDGSEYVANVYTQAEFGCAMWAERD